MPSLNLESVKNGLLKRWISEKPYLVDLGIVFLLVVATFVINWRMISDGINGMIDLKWHITWIQHFSKQLAEGIWYPRWLAGTNYGYGSPTFVFYPPIVHYIGSLLKLIGLNIEQAIITLFSLALFCSGLTFYIYGRDRWGKIASFVGALAYMTAPYLAFIIYWVGSVSSIFAQPLIPLGLWLTQKAIGQPKWRVALALYWTTLALVHLPSLLLCAVVWLPYTFFLLLKHSWKAVVGIIISVGFGLSIASFYLLPAILEQKLINIDLTKKIGGGFEANMLGGSTLPLIPLSFDFRVPHIFVHQLLAILVLASIALLFCRKNKAIRRETFYWLGFALLLAFLMTSFSWPIWQASPTLQRVQTPTRLLLIFTFAGSALFGVVASEIFKLQLRSRILLSVILIGILLINTSYGYKLSRQFPTFRKPGRANLEHLEYIKKALYDPFTEKLIDLGEYRPLLKDGKPAPEPIVGQPRLSTVSGQAEIQIERWGSYQRLFKATAKKTSIIRIRTYYYPAWHLYVNQKPYPIDVSAEDGTMKLTLEPGTYSVQLRYQWTKAFTLGVILSTMSILALVLLWVKSPRSLGSPTS